VCPAAAVSYSQLLVTLQETGTDKAAWSARRMMGRKQSNKREEEIAAVKGINLVVK
jgi:hypothetical protein